MFHGRTAVCECVFDVSPYHFRNRGKVSIRLCDALPPTYSRGSNFRRNSSRCSPICSNGIRSKPGNSRENNGALAEVEVQFSGVDEARIGFGYEAIRHLPIATLHRTAVYDQV